MPSFNKAALLIRTVIAILFVAAGVTKLIDPSSFAAVLVRHERIGNDLSMGVVHRINLPEVAVTFAQKLEPILSENVNRKHEVVLFLRSPSCDKCISELLYWNSSDVSRRIDVVGVFANSAHGDPDALVRVLGLCIRLVRIPDETYQHLVGKHAPFVTRVLLTNRRAVQSFADSADQETGKEFHNAIAALMLGE